MLVCKIICFEVFPGPHHTTLFSCCTEEGGKNSIHFGSCAAISTKYLKLGLYSKRGFPLSANTVEMRTDLGEEGG